MAKAVEVIEFAKAKGYVEVADIAVGEMARVIMVWRKYKRKS
jgi:hypothetical protein